MSRDEFMEWMGTADRVYDRLHWDISSSLTVSVWVTAGPDRNNMVPALVDWHSDEGGVWVLLPISELHIPPGRPHALGTPA